MSLRILVVCTANRCRSPMAERFLRRALPGAHVGSAGTLEPGWPASGGSVRAMASRGVDLGDHSSRRLDAELVGGADLVVCMARRHVRDVAMVEPTAFPRTFTLRELVRRGEAVGPASDVASWLALVGEGRRASDLLGDHPDDDVADPIGGPDEGYERTAAQLEALVERLVRLLAPALGA